MVPGTKIRFHGGYDGKREDRCSVCKFTCGHIWTGVIEEQYTVWDTRSEQFLPHPNLWTALLETGAYTSGYLEQFVLDEA